MEIKQFQRAAGISEALAARWFSHITSAMKEFGISKAEDQAMFIAQVGHESGASPGCRRISTTVSADWLTSFGLGVSLRGRLMHWGAVLVNHHCHLSASARSQIWYTANAWEQCPW